MTSQIPKTHVYVRHCFFSPSSATKGRPDGFSRAKLFAQLIETLRPDDRLVILLDTHGRKGDETHFTASLPGHSHQCIVEIDAGTDAKSFTHLCNLIEKDVQSGTVSHSDMVVFLEDDYAVAPDWQDAVSEGLKIADYVTLYDHPDKYVLPMYKDLVSRIYISPTCHFRTVPSTTNSFACRASIFLGHFDIHLEFCDSRIAERNRDHEKFLALWSFKNNRPTLISSIPAYWSHEEVGMQCKLSSTRRKEILDV